MTAPASAVRRLLAALLVWAAGLLGFAPMADAAKWIRIESEHLVVYTDAAAAEAVPVVRNVELLIAAWHEMFPEYRRPGGPRLPYFLFAKGIPSVEAGGYFLNREGTFIDSIMVSSLRTREHHAIFHEMVHSFMRVSRPSERRPGWFEEGQAELYSEVEFTPTELKLGLPIPGAIGFLRREGLIPLADLFAFSRQKGANQPGGPNPERLSRYNYTQGWLFQHYTRIQAPPDLPAGGFDRFAAALRRGEPVATGFEAAFGCTLAEMDQRLQRYLSQKTLPAMAVPLMRLKVKEPFAIAPATPADLAYMQANMAESGKEPQKMKAKIAEGFAAFPDDARIQILKAHDLFTERRYAEAETCFRKILATMPDHPKTNLGLATAICLQQPNPPLPERAREAVTHFGRAYELGVESGGEIAFARALLALPDTPTDAQVGILVGALRNGLNEVQALMTANLLDRQGKRAEAKAMLEWVIAEGKNERQVAEARRRLQRFSSQPANERDKPGGP